MEEAVERSRYNNGFSKLKIVEEVKKQAWLAGPLITVNLLQFCLQLVSIMFVGHLGKLPLSGLSKEALSDMLTFIKLAVPSALMVCLEMWSGELMVLLSGLLPNPQLETSVLSICLSTAATLYMIPFGLSGAISTRVSNELGAGHPQMARLALYVVLAVTVTVGLVFGFVIILIRNVWGYAYSNEIEVVRYISIMMPLLATSYFLDCLQCVLSGAIRGFGRQEIGAIINLGSFYLVGIPAAVLLAFVLHIGGKGLWTGTICGLLAQAGFYLVVTLRTNWEQEAQKAKERVEESTFVVY